MQVGLQYLYDRPYWFTCRNSIHHKSAHSNIYCCQTTTTTLLTYTSNDAVDVLFSLGQLELDLGYFVPEEQQTK